ncbi:MAG TPA: dienelactone hydrolase family protein [Candidatus Polarisedimenticolia bacterium]|nr:dienelactone hydrolase family protein [Candidatus Polarisedimenticolia bacterium]
MRLSIASRRPFLRIPIALIPVLSGAPLGALHAAEGQNLQLQVGDESVRAFLVEESADASRPGVVVVHGWWGLNEQMRGVAERVAELGYTAIVPDLYRGRLPADLGYAYDFMRELDEERVMRILKGAIQHLRSMPGAARRPVGMIGFDMGGQLTFSAAIRGLPVQAAVSFYGDTRHDRDEIGALQIPFLGIYASDDRATPPDQVAQFESILAELGKDAEIVVMADAGRYFSNEDRPGYNPEATKNAWGHTREFLSGHLNGAEFVPQRKGKPFNDERVEKDPRWKKKQPPPPPR